jgi:serine/threonine-protein kinase
MTNLVLFEDLGGEREAQVVEPAGEADLEPILGGRYAILEEVGRGGMGVVYRAFDRRLRRTVAVKLPAPGREAGARLLAEARLTARLEHPGIPPVHDIGVDARGRPFFVMKLVAGRTLAELLGFAEARGVGAAGLARLTALLLEVARAVAYAHRRGIVHCDLKPENVMVGRWGEVLVLDWGLARAAAWGGMPSADLAPLSRARGGGAVGTPAFMAPEQALGPSVQLGPWTDVYALGTILYAILAGRPPFVGASAGEIMRRACFEDPAPPRAFRPCAPPALEAIALRALAKKPRDRFAGARELARALERALGAEVRAPAGRLRRAVC